MHRRSFLLSSSGASLGTLSLTSLTFCPLHAQQAPTTDPLAKYDQAWTTKLPWARVLDITTMPGSNWDAKLNEAQAMLSVEGGGVVFFPTGHYTFSDHIQLKDGIILRGADTTKDAGPDYKPTSMLSFPAYKPTFFGSGTPIDTAFKGIYLERPNRASNVGIVNLSINRGHIHFKEDEQHRSGRNRFFVGCRLTNAAVADPRVGQNPKVKQHSWQRFTHRHHAAIEIKGTENILIANNSLPQSGEENFRMDDYMLKPTRNGPDRFDGVIFDYDNRPALYISHYCVGGGGGSGNDGTPETHPFGFRKGIVIIRNYVYNSGRMGIGFCGDGVICSHNTIRFAKDVWRPTNTGINATSGSSTNDNRAIEMRGWNWVLENNNYEVHRNWAADRKYLINDGEGLMHEDHCNSDLRGSRLVNNQGNSYLSIYKCGLIDGLHVEGNEISTPGKISDIFVVATRNSGDQPVRNVAIVNNITHSNGISLVGSPATNNVISGNIHKGKTPGHLKNQGEANVSKNQNYA